MSFSAKSLTTSSKIILLLLALFSGMAHAAPDTDNFGWPRPEDGNATWGPDYRAMVSDLDQYMPAKRMVLALTSGVSNGEAVTPTTTGRLTLADASGTASADVVGVAESCLSTSCLVVFSGKSGHAYSGLTPGSTYYVSDSTPGAITATIPTSPSVVSIVGTATTSTELLVNPIPNFGTISSGGGSFDPANSVSVIPTTDDTYNLGTNAKRWSEVFKYRTNWSVSNKTASFSPVDEGSYTIRDTVSSDVQISLPSVSAYEGTVFSFSRQDTSSYRVYLDGGSTQFNGASGYTEAELPNQNSSVLIQSDGTYWNILASHVYGDPAGSSFYKIEPPVNVGTWIGTSTTTYTSVDFTASGVPDDATAVSARLVASSSSGSPAVYCSPTLATYTAQSAVWWIYATTPDSRNSILALDGSGAATRCAFSSSWTASYNLLYIDGYWAPEFRQPVILSP